ncbi:MAG TPA: zinc transporter ZupT [Pseudobacteroides sp.]|nr:zinc transporter ZupT [Pseudobacteroides sp.]
MNNNILLAFGLTLLAGLSTGIGSAIAFFAKKTNTKFLAFSLGFSAGVMIYVSMIEIFAQAQKSLIAELGLKAGSWVTVASFFGGMFLIALIDKVIPNEENPHHLHKVEDLKEEKVQIEDNLMRTGIFTALAVGIHNFPEGLATFISALQQPTIAIPITVAIAIHNIPEGISISAPVYYATGDRKKAFYYSFLSGLAEPIGALIGYLLLMPFLNETVFGIVFGIVAGIMVYISLDELLPSAHKYGDHHLSIAGLMSGMGIMALSLLLFI